MALFRTPLLMILALITAKAFATAPGSSIIRAGSGSTPGGATGSDPAYGTNGMAVAPGAGMGMGMGMGPGSGMGIGPGMGMGRGPAGMGDYMAVWQALIMDRGSINRQWKPIATGIESETTSKDPRIAKLIQLHVAQMRGVLDACGAQGGCDAPLRRWDPLFQAVFANADKLRLKITNTTSNGAPAGVRVQETGASGYAVELARAHAAVVSNFIKSGPVAMMKAHAAPPKNQD